MDEGSRVTPAIFPTMSAGVTRSFRPTLRKIIALPGSRPVRAGRSYFDLRGRSSASGAVGAETSVSFDRGAVACCSIGAVRSVAGFTFELATGFAHAGA